MSWRETGRIAHTNVAALTRHLSWREAAHHFGLNWKSVAAIVQRAKSSPDFVSMRPTYKAQAVVIRIADSTWVSNFVCAHSSQ